MRLLVTGAAGFIGYHVSKALCERGIPVVGVDNLNSYYDVELKKARLAELEKLKGFRFIKLDLCNVNAMDEIPIQLDGVIHLAAQAGVRFSKNHPRSYFDSNLAATFNVLEFCRAYDIRKVLAASSSSVYGNGPCVETAVLPSPLSFYAASKQMAEIMYDSYCQSHNLDIVAMRFFSVYGPWGRPDMALGKFAEALSKKQPININGNGSVMRDMTYVGDVVAVILKLLEYKFEDGGFMTLNIGGGQPVSVRDMVDELATALGVREPYNISYGPAIGEDSKITCADTHRLKQLFDFVPATPFGAGILKFADWWRKHYGSSR